MTPRTAPDLVHLAFDALRGVGAPEAGEWVETGHVAVHVRRRLTDEERGGLVVIDVRGTPEGARRLATVARYLPEGYHE